jgi:hypothetical protein
LAKTQKVVMMNFAIHAAASGHATWVDGTQAIHPQ